MVGARPPQLAGTCRTSSTRAPVHSVQLIEVIAWNQSGRSPWSNEYTLTHLCGSRDNGGPKAERATTVIIYALTQATTQVLDLKSNSVTQHGGISIVGVRAHVSPRESTLVAGLTTYERVFQSLLRLNLADGLRWHHHRSDAVTRLSRSIRYSSRSESPRPWQAKYRCVQIGAERDGPDYSAFRTTTTVQ